MERWLTIAIPIISEIFSFIQSFIQVFPKSIRYLIFLLFLIGTFAIIPFILHMMGIHCDSNKNIMKTSFFSFSDNYIISTMTTEDYYNISDFVPETQFSITPTIFSTKKISCAPLIKFDHSSIFSGDFYTLCNKNDTMTNNTQCFYALRIHTWKEFFFPKTPKCIICDNITLITFTDVDPFSDNAINGKYCLSDAYSNNETGCGDVEKCEIPLGYKFEKNTGNFVCFDKSICETNMTEITYSVDVKLKSLNAKRYYSTVQNDKDYKSTIKLKCDSNLNPQITFFGVPIFDYKLWILLMVLGALFFWLSHIKNQ